MKEVKELVRLAKKVIAGGEDFYTFGRGSNANQAFRDAVEEARHESGHGGYTGTIAEKASYGFKVVAGPMTREAAYDKAQELVEGNEKWGPAYAIPVVGKGAEKVIDVEEVEYARTSQEAVDLLKKELDDKYKAKGLAWVMSNVKVTVEKSSNVSLKVRAKEKPVVGFQYVLSFHHGTRFFDDLRSAVEALKADLEADRVAGRDLPKEVAIRAYVKNPNSLVIDLVQRSQRGNKYRVMAPVKVSKPSGNVEGYLFFGVASS